MSTAAIVISFFLFIAFLVGLVKPSVLLGKGAGRGKAFLVFFLPSVILFFVGGYLTNEEYDEAWANPEGVTRLVLSKKGFTKLPDRLSEFQQLEELILKNNNISELDEDILKSMPNLKKLDLENNPISELPEWMAELGLESLELDGTNITTIPEGIRQAIKDIDYDKTPLALEEKVTYEALKDSLQDQGYPQTESFGDFAVRKLMGKDYGYDKQFKKGTLYYTKGVPDDKIDSLGQFLVNNGYFTDEREVSMQLKYNDRTGVNAYELRAVYAGGDEPLEEDLHAIFELLTLMISKEVFEDMPVHFHLTDDEFKESLYVFRSDGKEW